MYKHKNIENDFNHYDIAIVKVIKTPHWKGNLDNIERRLPVGAITWIRVVKERILNLSSDSNYVFVEDNRYLKNFEPSCFELVKMITNATELFEYQKSVHSKSIPVPRYRFKTREEIKVQFGDRCKHWNIDMDYLYGTDIPDSLQVDAHKVFLDGTKDVARFEIPKKIGSGSWLINYRMITNKPLPVGVVEQKTCDHRSSVPVKTVIYEDIQYTRGVDPFKDDSSFLMKEDDDVLIDTGVKFERTDHHFVV